MRIWNPKMRAIRVSFALDLCYDGQLTKIYTYIFLENGSQFCFFFNHTSTTHMKSICLCKELPEFLKNPKI